LHSTKRLEQDPKLVLSLAFLASLVWIHPVRTIESESPGWILDPPGFFVWNPEDNSLGFFVDDSANSTRKTRRKS
jgi:hypothetical protein